MCLVRQRVSTLTAQAPRDKENPYNALAKCPDLFGVKEQISFCRRDPRRCGLALGRLRPSRRRASPHALVLVRVRRPSRPPGPDRPMVVGPSTPAHAPPRGAGFIPQTFPFAGCELRKRGRFHPAYIPRTAANGRCQRQLAAHGSREEGPAPGVEAGPELGFYAWWQVLGSNQRRRCRRFYRASES